MFAWVKILTTALTAFPFTAPSPDWFVGVAALNLCLRNCSWTDSKIIPLYPWDAGTDSGISYLVSPVFH